MKKNNKLFNLFVIATMTLTYQSCKGTDPIPPVVVIEDPTLTVSPAELAFPGAGGEFVLDLTTNSKEVICSFKPDWVESVTFDATFKKATVKAKAVSTGTLIVKEDKLVLTTKSGATYETDANVFLLQGIENGNLISEPFAKATAPTGWVVTGTASKVKYDNGFVELTSIKDKMDMTQTRLLCKISGSEVLSGITSKGNNVYASVDFQPVSGTIGMGMCIYMNDTDPNNFFQYFAVMNSVGGTMWAFEKGVTANAAALGDPIPGDPLKWGGTKPGLPLVEDVPAAGIEPYFRMEITNTYNTPYWWQYQVSIWSLQTIGGITKKYKLHYTRKFETNGVGTIPKPGYFGIWVKGGEGDVARFKNFRLSFQKN